ncbi:PucR family transcriptional regulator ligand-binding domain-containing protein [Streptomyces phaeochromogenes]|uniref:PucR family transcriptional regulator ligand-binding domain-containing protein n=1 Tax=Streptomyces phaeochromogenes TaxID=1923 RepID=UPI003696D436
MGVPLTWLLRRPGLGLKVLAGRAGLDREVDWKHSIELADPVPWLGGGELVLTTGLRLPASDEAPKDYVRHLAKAGVAALGFGVGLSHARVPDALVEAAEATGLPLLEVPLPTPFVAVTKAVMERPADQQYEGVVQASRIQPRMDPGRTARRRPGRRTGTGRLHRDLGPLPGPRRHPSRLAPARHRHSGTRTARPAGRGGPDRGGGEQRSRRSVCSSRAQAAADVAGEIDWDVSVDSTIVRTHQHAAGVRADPPPSPAAKRAEVPEHQDETPWQSLHARLVEVVREVRAWAARTAASPHNST